MPEEAVIDGSNLEGNVETPQTEAVQPQAEQPAQTEQPPQSNIPEQFREYTPEQWFNEWNKTNSMLGRYKQEVTDLRHKTQPVYQPQYQQPPIPSSLPGHEALGQRQPQPNLNETFLENPADVVKQIVAQEVRQGIQSYQQQQVMAQQQEAMSRVAWINSVDDDELQNLRLDENVNFTPQHQALMKALAETDPAVISKLRTTNLSEQDIRSTVRDLHKRADGILNGDPERQKAFAAAQKQAAISGAPAARASTQAGPVGTRPADLDERWGFLLNE